MRISTAQPQTQTVPRQNRSLYSQAQQGICDLWQSSKACQQATSDELSRRPLAPAVALASAFAARISPQVRSKVLQVATANAHHPVLSLFVALGVQAAPYLARKAGQDLFADIIGGGEASQPRRLAKSQVVMAAYAGLQAGTAAALGAQLGVVVLVLMAGSSLLPLVSNTRLHSSKEGHYPLNRYDAAAIVAQLLLAPIGASATTGVAAGAILGSLIFRATMATVLSALALPNLLGLEVGTATPLVDQRLVPGLQSVEAEGLAPTPRLLAAEATALKNSLVQDERGQFCWPRRMGLCIAGDYASGKTASVRALADDFDADLLSFDAGSLNQLWAPGNCSSDKLFLAAWSQAEQRGVRTNRLQILHIDEPGCWLDPALSSHTSSFVTPYLFRRTLFAMAAALHDISTPVLFVVTVKDRIAIERSLVNFVRMSTVDLPNATLDRPQLTFDRSWRQTIRPELRTSKMLPASQLFRTALGERNLLPAGAAGQLAARAARCANALSARDLALSDVHAREKSLETTIYDYLAETLMLANTDGEAGLEKRPCVQPFSDARQRLSELNKLDEVIGGAIQNKFQAATSAEYALNVAASERLYSSGSGYLQNKVISNNRYHRFQQLLNPMSFIALPVPVVGPNRGIAPPYPSMYTPLGNHQLKASRML